jgi:hypothetical protein
LNDGFTLQMEVADSAEAPVKQHYMTYQITLIFVFTAVKTYPKLTKLTRISLALFNFKMQNPNYPLKIKAFYYLISSVLLIT